MTLALGSVLLSLLNLASSALIAERRRAGWLVALAAQIPWTWYDMWTRQLGFLLLTLIYVPVYVRGWRKAQNLAHPPPGTAGGPPAAKTPSGRLAGRACGACTCVGAAAPERARSGNQGRELKGGTAGAARQGLDIRLATE